MISHRQKFLLHHYARLAGISDATYRRALLSCAGVRSAADADMTQRGFERAMAALEVMLSERVAQGVVLSPVGRDRHVAAIDYWRGRVPRDGYANTRQIHRIHQLWGLLSDTLPEPDRWIGYLLRIVTRAIGRSAPSDLVQLTAAESGWVIDALSDRLAYAYEDTADGPRLHGAVAVPEAASVLPF